MPRRSRHDLATQRRRLPMVRMPEYVLEGPSGEVRLVDQDDARFVIVTQGPIDEALADKERVRGAGWSGPRLTWFAASRIVS